MDSADVMRRLDRELELDSAQHAIIAAVFQRRQATMDSLWATVQPQVRTVLVVTLHEMMAPLRPDQRAKYRAMVERLHPGMLDSRTPD
jgi:hypothetical protein